jgi:putative transposase
VSTPRYEWRRLSPEQRAELVAWRKANGRPWHSPPHRPNYGQRQFHLAAACYEHRPHIGRDEARLDSFSRDLLDVLAAHATRTHAWCVLPNHYHAVVEAPDVTTLLEQLGRFHGRTSHAWNGEENSRGRKVFFCAVERAMRSERHFWTTLNYVHHNAVRHGYVRRWTEWPWSSAPEYLEQIGEKKARRVWRAYPVRDYGRGWDEPDM